MVCGVKSLHCCTSGSRARVRSLATRIKPGLIYGKSSKGRENSNSTVHLLGNQKVCKLCCRGDTSPLELVTQTRLVLIRSFVLVLEAHGVCRLLVSALCFCHRFHA